MIGKKAPQYGQGRFFVQSMVHKEDRLLKYIAILSYRDDLADKLQFFTLTKGCVVIPSFGEI
jgi:hypothetical protein